ncbi:MAG: hypothetical protein WC855_12980 [Thermodesulfovibrionales bacterium]
MDITNTTANRFDLGIQLFLEGQPISFEEVLFWKEDEKVLHVDSYSEWEPQNTTPEIAKEKITRSKTILAELSEKSSEFAKVAKGLPHEYYFCYDYGKGSVALAKEVNSQFTWLEIGK